MKINVHPPQNNILQKLEKYEMLTPQKNDVNVIYIFTRNQLRFFQAHKILYQKTTALWYYSKQIGCVASILQTEKHGRQREFSVKIPDIMISKTENKKEIISIDVCVVFL